MNKQEFIKATRLDGKHFRADSVTIDTGKDELSGYGIVRVAKGQFVIEVTLDEATKAPKLPTGFWGRSDFWKIRGVIEGGIRFLVYDLPSCSSEHWGEEEGKRVTLTFSTNHMELEPSGLERLTDHEISEMLDKQKTQRLPQSADIPAESRAARPEAAAKSQTSPVQAQAPDVEVWFDAVILDFKLIAHNGGTHITEKNDFLGERSRSSQDTFQGEMQEWKFGLIQREGDLDVHLRSKTSYRSEGEDQDQRRFQAFLDALAFTHGQHAWPFSVEHRRDGKLIRHRVHLHNTVARTPHAPFAERLALNAAVGKLSWDFQRVLQTVYAFFCLDSKLSRETTQLLYLCREAGSSNVPNRITLLSLCSLLESLVQVIYAERINSQRLAETTAFDAAKKHVCDELKQKIPKLGDPLASPYQRILTILTNAESTNLRMKFQAVIEHLSLRPEDEWQQLFALWTGCRNPLSHRMAESDDSEASVKQNMVAESNIAGSINCMVLKLMGYSGWVQRSAFEGKYAEI